MQICGDCPPSFESICLQDSQIWRKWGLGESQRVNGCFIFVATFRYLKYKGKGSFDYIILLCFCNEMRTRGEGGKQCLDSYSDGKEPRLFSG